MLPHSSPLFDEAEMARYRRSWHYRKFRLLMAIFGPFMKIPIVSVAAVFWFGVLDEGLRSTIKPRWGLLTFHFLNDGMRPTLWHTWQQIIGAKKYDGIWSPRAPRDADDAERILAYYRDRAERLKHGNV